MAGRKSDFTLPTLDDLFSTQEIRDEAKLAKIRDIPIDLIDDFPDHPYKVRDDEDMMQLVESIKERGVITPATVRQKEDGRYELISGHRRKRASELAGLEMLRCEVVELDRDEATILMVESNLQRSVILPSEKAFAYKMRLDAMKRKAGRPSKENVSPVGTNLRTDEIIAQETGDSRNQIHRYNELGYIENCTVKNATVTGKHVDNGDYCGDKIGGIVGFLNAHSVKNCKVKNTTITAGRDAGQVIGCAVSGATVENCTASDVTVTASGDCTGANVRNEIVGRDLR